MKLDPSWQLRKLSARQFKILLANCGLNQTTAARYLGLSIRTLRRMAAGDARVPVAALLLLHLMRKHQEEPDVPPVKRRRRSR